MPFDPNPTLDPPSCSYLLATLHTQVHPTSLSLYLYHPMPYPRALAQSIPMKRISLNQWSLYLYAELLSAFILESLCSKLMQHTRVFEDAEVSVIGLAAFTRPSRRH